MRNRIDTFGAIIIVGFSLVCALGFIRMYLDHSDDLPSLLATYGVWLILSFFIMTSIVGIGKGVDRAKIQIPKKIAIIVFTIAGLLFLASGIVSGGI
jgi:type III secretory pathway component EscR